jgi:hypothetical protein
VANTLLTVDQITRASLEIAHEKLTFIGTVNQQFDPSFKGTPKIGDTLRIRMPNRYTRRQGSRIMDVQDQAEESQNLTVATQDGVDMRFNGAELSLSIEEFSKRYISPALSVLVSGVEGDMLASVTKDVYQVTGTPGTVVGASADMSAITNARAKLNQQLAPKDGQRSVQFDSVTMGSVVNGIKGIFHEGKQLTEAFREGFISRNAMADWYENERTHTHTNGADADVAWAVDDTAALAAADASPNAGLSTLVFDAAGSTLPTVGSVFTIAGAFDCHPETKQKYAHLKQLVITAASSAAGSHYTLTFSPTLYVTGARQNIWTATGAFAELEDDATVLVGAASGVYRQNLMYHMDAFTFVTADLPIMADASLCVRRRKDDLSLRVWQGSDIRNDEMLMRIDILYGYKTIRPEWACRITN